MVTGNNTKIEGEHYYFEPNQPVHDRRSAYIRCPTEGATYPQCRHHFYYKNFKYKITYNIQNLENWKKIKQQIIEFVESKKCEEDPV